MTKTTLTVLIVLGVAAVGAIDAEALADNKKRKGGRDDGNGQFAQSASASVPEPSALYAVGTGLAVLGGAGWYIRRRK
jgi:hypothetical protein